MMIWKSPVGRAGAALIGSGLLAALGVFALWGDLQLPSRAAATPPIPTASPIPPGAPTRLATIDPPTRTPTAVPTPLPHPTSAAATAPAQVDYGPLTAALNAYIEQEVHPRGFDLGIGFVDLQTGQEISLNGEARQYALSTFKGPLAAYYLWLVERGLLAPQPDDLGYIEPMLAISSNPAATCVFERVGGLEPFNDWLAYQGMSRENNFVFAWSSWPCYEGASAYTPEPDWRYSRGDESLGLPGGNALRHCQPDNTICDKAFSPIELARFYARLGQGQVIDEESLAIWLNWTARDESAFQAWLPEQARLPEDESIRVYTKNGFRAADSYYDLNFFHEAGLIDTGQGAFALAVFMPGNPDWPGMDTLTDVAQIVYRGFLAAHEAGG